MKIKFWGTRGSIPVSLVANELREKLIAAVSGARGVDLESLQAVSNYIDGLPFSTRGTYGGHSSCVQLDTGDAATFILDAGSGLRPLGQTLIDQFGANTPRTYHLFLSHLHWDHIMGFPFFTPAYIGGNRIVLHACHAHAEAAMRRQQDHPSFPVNFNRMGAKIEFNVVRPGETFTVADMKVTSHLQRHSGESFGWRFEHQGVEVVYTTDSEHHVDDATERAGFIEFFRDADVVIFDAMYSLADAISVKEDWGHSSNVVGVELCQAAKARRLILFHHEPAYNDAQIEQVLNETRRFEEITRDDHTVEVLSAYDGLELTL